MKEAITSSPPLSENQHDLELQVIGDAGRKSLVLDLNIHPYMRVNQI